MVTYMTLIYIMDMPFLFASSQPLKIIAVVVINTLFFPAWAIFLMRRLGLFASIEMDTQKERIIPLIATMTFYIWAFLVVRKIHLPSGIVVFVLGAVITQFLIFFINIFSKISIHMAGITGLAIALLIQMSFLGFDFRYPLVMVVFLIGLVAWARLEIDAHTPRELYSGMLVGALSQVTALAIFPVFN